MGYRKTKRDRQIEAMTKIYAFMIAVVVAVIAMIVYLISTFF